MKNPAHDADGPIDERRTMLRALGGAATLMTLLIAAACTSYVQQQQQAAQQKKIEEDRLRLSVYTSDLTEPYRKLGMLSYTDPLNGETIESDHINEKLRQMAIARWGQQVDAVILVKTKVGADGSTISVSGEAVRMTGECSGCRHSQPPPA